MWDTSGDEFIDSSVIKCKRFDAIVICLSYDSRRSLDELNNWIDHANKICKTKNNSPSMLDPIIIVLTKFDKQKKKFFNKELRKKLYDLVFRESVFICSNMSIHDEFNLNDYNRTDILFENMIKILLKGPISNQSSNINEVINRKSSILNDEEEIEVFSFKDENFNINYNNIPFHDFNISFENLENIKTNYNNNPLNNFDNSYENLENFSHNFSQFNTNNKRLTSDSKSETKTTKYKDKNSINNKTTEVRKIQNRQIRINKNNNENHNIINNSQEISNIQIREEFYLRRFKPNFEKYSREYNRPSQPVYLGYSNSSDIKKSNCCK